MVERPASVVKELLENSIDAGATQVDLTVENGGVHSIEVRDNGAGINVEDLPLALAQHATSKISTAIDLECIESLGFRGEALASINSVAKVTITSNTEDQDHAWSIKNSNITPAAHPVGTTITVKDIFYNVPARKKFLRSNRTEYHHVEEVFRRIALSRFDVGFTLQNYDKVLKSLPVCVDANARLRRLYKLCGNRKDILEIDAEQNGLQLHGWLGSVEQARSQEPHQYFFINGRVIRDRLINHAIRQVYQPLCLDGKMPFYCLYLELDPVALDVNVHPTKHEVRFRDARVIHAFITNTLRDALGIEKHERMEEFVANNYRPAAQNFSILTTLDNKLVIAQQDDKLLFLDINKVRKQLWQTNKEVIDLRSPVVVSIRFEQDFIVWCMQFGFVLEASGPDSVLLRSIPSHLQDCNYKYLDMVILLKDLWRKKKTVESCWDELVKAFPIKIESKGQKWLEYSATELEGLLGL